ncbi:hypothetical protein A2765_03975 [Candidatus Kaiserbacteria bacterium RIFCSPHIGHO2_01_FULL_56_24]|uniref:DUF1150 domain-containing protein n=1 Tax=Candidatus Kaiserbacteria bacterium RIFCSPHIGHO2_01_FULL_56_24 TaxID=1798487 RepID=A0A1F6DFV8_9BACT|nr:MAG: hypothetical protein A2765_03975 [Candidatus Kaiserbacteria bacterium RIFCSPHIGHO2_01_FULL_56_24]
MLRDVSVGTVVYLKPTTSEELSQQYPDLQGLPAGVQLFALYSAEGNLLSLSDTRQAAIGSAISDNLELSLVH